VVVVVVAVVEFRFAVGLGLVVIGMGLLAKYCGEADLVNLERGRGGEWGVSLLINRNL
jgi:hypothetical protein